MGLIIKTDDKGLKIWRSDRGQYPSYSYSIGKKDTNGNYENCYQSVRFRKGVNLDNGTEIAIDNAFMSFDTGKDGRKWPYLFISDFRIIGGGNNIPDANEYMNIPDKIDEALPFR